MTVDEWEECRAKKEQFVRAQTAKLESMGIDSSLVTDLGNGVAVSWMEDGEGRTARYYWQIDAASLPAK